jgi:integrase
MLQKLTKTAVEAAKPGKRRTFIWDSGDGSTKGFGLKIMPSGHKAFIYQYRMAGGRRAVTQRYTIGPFSTALTVAKARVLAEQLERDVAAGIDPIARGHSENEQKKAAKAAEVAAEKGRVELVVEGYLEALEHRKKPLRTLKERRRLLAYEFIGTEERPGPWRGRLITEISPKDIKDVLKKVIARGSVGSLKKVLDAIRQVFNYAVSEEYRKDNPALGIDLKALGYATRARDRYLTPAELKAVWLAADRTPYPFGPFVKLLILTAQREGEVAGMAKSELTPESLTPWKIPGERAKNGEQHTVHLSQQALAVIASLPITKKLIFTTNGKRPISGFSKAKKALDKASGVKDWRFHDLRRTFATTATEVLKIAPHVTDKILNHKSGAINGIQAVYQKAQFLEERETALNAWGNYVESLMNKKPTNVVPIKTSRA